VEVIRKKVRWLADIYRRRSRPGDVHPDAVPELDLGARPRRTPTRELPESDRLTLERWAKSRSASFRLVLRSRIVLMVHGGMSMAATAKALGTTPRTVRLWCRRFGQGGAEALRRDAPGRGRRPGLSADVVERIVALTTEPADGRRPTARMVAVAAGTSPASVCRVWAARGIGPVRRQGSQV
jgi:hypothetical protein